MKHQVGNEIVRMEKVVKRFGNFTALNEVDVSIAEGEVVVIIGPSGSGKSTLLRTINRLERHDAGRIIVDGVELTDDMRSLAMIRAETGMVFQSFNLFPHLSVMSNITLAPIKVRKTPAAEAKESALELLRRVGIEEQADKYPAQLSGGQQQRVAIARALAMQPKVMLFDEPTSAPRPGDDQRGARRYAGAGEIRHDDAGRLTRNGFRAGGGGPDDDVRRGRLGRGRAAGANLRRPAERQDQAVPIADTLALPAVPYVERHEPTPGGYWAGE